MEAPRLISSTSHPAIPCWIHRFSMIPWLPCTNKVMAGGNILFQRSNRRIFIPCIYNIFPGSIGLFLPDCYSFIKKIYLVAKRIIHSIIIVLNCCKWPRNWISEYKLHIISIYHGWSTGIKKSLTREQKNAANSYGISCVIVFWWIVNCEEVTYSAKISKGISNLTSLCSFMVAV